MVLCAGENFENIVSLLPPAPDKPDLLSIKREGLKKEERLYSSLQLFPSPSTTAAASLGKYLRDEEEEKTDEEGA